MKYVPDHSSRFRILKGGKISLVVSALLVGTTTLTAVQTTVVSTATTTALTTAIDQDMTVTSFGSITLDTTGDLSGVSATTVPFSSTISNAGTIDVTTTSYYGAEGISVQQYLSSTGTITNTGTISVTSGGNGSATGIRAVMYYDSEITNSGTISATTVDGTAIGIHASTYYYNSAARITNSGTISAEANNYARAYGVNVYDMYGTSSITNAAIKTISATTSSGSAYGIYVRRMNDSSSITNSGVLSATSTYSGSATGIYASRMYSAAGITNSGTISAEATYYGRAYGVNVYAMYGTSSITNAATKTISATTDTGDAYGIYVRTMNDSSSITNSGVLSATSTNGSATGIHVDSGLYSTSSIINHGSINVTADGDATGMDVYYINNDATVINHGSISVTSTNGSAYGIYGGYYGGYYGGHYGGMHQNGSFVNNNSITVTANNGNAFGIAYESMYDNSSIINNGSITVSATNGNAYGTYGVYLYDNASFTNAGTITATSTTYSAFGFYGGIYYTSTLTNSGTITATGVSDSFGIYLSRMRNDAVLTNSGTIAVTSSGGNASGIHTRMYDNASILNSISGTISADAATGYKSYGIYTTYSYNGNTITNDGTITATVNGAADYNGFALHVNGYEAVGATINNSGTLNGNVHAGTSTIFNNSGTINLPYNANTNTTAAQVDTFTQTADGVLKIGLMSDSNGVMEHSQLVANMATFASGSTITVNVLSASGNQSLLIGERMDDVVNATTSLTVGALNITDNSALLNFEIIEDVNSVNDGHTIDLNIVKGTTITDATTAGGGGSSSTASTALDTINDGNYPGMDPVITALNGLATNEEVARAVASTTPLATVSAQVAGTQIMNNVQGIVELRQNSTMGGGLNSGDAGLSEQNLWIKPFGSKGEQENKDGVSGFDFKAHGLGVGYDAEYAPNQRAGLAFFYTDADVKVKEATQNSDVKVYNILAYGNVPLDTTNNFLYQAGYAWQSSEGSRYIGLTGDTAKSDYTSKAATIDLKLMQTHKMDDRLTLHPLVNTTYRHFTTPTYSETGAGVLNLNVEESTSTQFMVGGGVIADYALDKTSYVMLDLTLSYDFHHKQGVATAAYEGAADVKFNTKGIDNGPWIYNIGAGYTMKTTDNSELNFMYNYQGQGTTFDVHTLSAKYVYKF